MGWYLYESFGKSHECQSAIVDVLFTTFSDFFRLIKLYIIRCDYELYWNTETLAKLDKNLSN